MSFNQIGKNLCLNSAVPSVVEAHYQKHAGLYVLRKSFLKGLPPVTECVNVSTKYNFYRFLIEFKLTQRRSRNPQKVYTYVSCSFTKTSTLQEINQQHKRTYSYNTHTISKISMA